MPISSFQIPTFNRNKGGGSANVAMLVRQPQPDVQKFKEPLALYFPAMPDTVDLERSAEYIVTPSQLFPDGIHIFDHTNPLVIPMSFKLHAFDPVYCKKNGAMTLLQIAAFLHSGLLPIKQSKGSVPGGGFKSDVLPGVSVKNSSSADTTGTGVAIGAASSTAVQQADYTAFFGTFFVGPPVFQLIVIDTGVNTPGIKANGYLKNVHVKLGKPWLRGRNGAFNLPSWGEFSFNFVHAPGFTDIFDSQGKVTDISLQAYSDTVIEKLYNTLGLAPDTPAAPMTPETVPAPAPKIEFAPITDRPSHDVHGAGSGFFIP